MCPAIVGMSLSAQTRYHHPSVEIFTPAITRSYQGATAKSWTGSSPATMLDSDVSPAARKGPAMLLQLQIVPLKETKCMYDIDLLILYMHNVSYRGPLCTQRLKRSGGRPLGSLWN